MQTVIGLSTTTFHQTGKTIQYRTSGIAGYGSFISPWILDNVLELAAHRSMWLEPINGAMNQSVACRLLYHICVFCTVHCPICSCNSHTLIFALSNNNIIININNALDDDNDKYILIILLTLCIMLKYKYIKSKYINKDRKLQPRSSIELRLKSKDDKFVGAVSTMAADNRCTMSLSNTATSYSHKTETTCKCQ